MAHTRQYDRRLETGPMQPSGEVAAVGRIFARDPETQVVWRIEPFEETTRTQYLLRYGALPSPPQAALDLLQEIVNRCCEKVVIHEAGHIVVGLHHGCRVDSAHLPVDPAEIAITDFSSDLEYAAADVWQDVYAGGCAAEAVALGRSSQFTSGVDRERIEGRYPGSWGAASKRAISILEQNRTALDAMSSALLAARELKEHEILEIWRSREGSSNGA